LDHYSHAVFLFFSHRTNPFLRIIARRSRCLFNEFALHSKLRPSEKWASHRVPTGFFHIVQEFVAKLLNTALFPKQAYWTNRFPLASKFQFLTTDILKKNLFGGCQKKADYHKLDASWHI